MCCAASDAVAVWRKKNTYKNFPHKLDVIEVEWVAIKCRSMEWEACFVEHSLCSNRAVNHIRRQWWWWWERMCLKNMWAHCLPACLLFQSCCQSPSLYYVKWIVVVALVIVWSYFNILIWACHKCSYCIILLDEAFKFRQNDETFH